MAHRNTPDARPATPAALDAGAVAQFRRDGATVLRGLLDDEWLTVIADAVEHNRRHPSAWSHWYTDPDEAVGFWSDYVTWRDVDGHRRVAFESPLAAAARSLMASSTVRFFHEHVLVKEPGATERTPWHHDQPYYCLDGDQNVSLWVALDSVPAATGMRFLAGSHRWNRWFVPRKFIDHTPYSAADDGYELVPDVDALIEDGAEVVTFEHRTGRCRRVPLPDAARRTGQRDAHATPGGELPVGRRRRHLRDPPMGGVSAVRPDGLVVGGSLRDDPRFPIVSD